MKDMNLLLDKIHILGTKAGSAVNRWRLTPLYAAIIFVLYVYFRSSIIWNDYIIIGVSCVALIGFGFYAQSVCRTFQVMHMIDSMVIICYLESLDSSYRQLDYEIFDQKIKDLKTRHERVLRIYPKNIPNDNIIWVENIKLHYE